MIKKTLFVVACALAMTTSAMAQQPQKTNVSTTEAKANDKAAEIKFATVTHDFGNFSEKDCPLTCTFEFTNVGNAPLIIHQAVTTCGCTVPNYPKDPIAPGGKGKIEVSYNGKGKLAGHFKKNITIRSNSGSASVVRLFIEGDMTKDE